MAAPIVANLRLILSCQRNRCRCLVNEFNRDQTLSTAIKHFHTRETALLTQEDRLSRIPVVSTKAEVRFHVETADWIPEDVRREVVLKNGTRINKSGELIVRSEISRSQQRNLEDCLEKISVMIAEASRQPAEPTEEDIALRQHRLQKRNLERLKQKKIHAATKQTRRVDFD